MSGLGPRRLAWDEPAPADLWDNLGIEDEGDEDAEQTEG